MKKIDEDVYAINVKLPNEYKSHTPSPQSTQKLGDIITQTRGRITTIAQKCQSIPIPHSPIHSAGNLCLSPIVMQNRSDSKIVEHSTSIGRVFVNEFDLSSNSETEPDQSSLGNISVNLTDVNYKQNTSHPTPEILFLSKEVLRPEFYKLTHDFLLERYYSKKLYESWDLSQLYKKISELSCSSPFEDEITTDKINPYETACSIFERWIFNHQQESGMILSFDFIMNHPTMILCLIFYWVQSATAVSPLSSKAERMALARTKEQARFNILKIMDNERDCRPREITRNYILFKLISEFYRYISEEPMVMPSQPLLRFIKESWKKIHESWLAGQDIKRNMVIETKHDIELLDKLYNNYQSKDKLILDRVTDIADLFDEADRNNILMMPLSDYFQTGLSHSKRKEVATRHNQMSCWLLSFVVRKAKDSVEQAMTYIVRYMELLKQFLKRENYQSGLLFGSVIATIKSFMPNIWTSIMESSNVPNLDDRIDEMVEMVNNSGFDSKGLSQSMPIFSNTIAYKLIESVRAQSHSHFFHMNFHNAIQRIAKKILACRRGLEQQLKLKKIPQVRLNLNQKFISTYIYEVFKRDNQLFLSSQYQELKREARRLDADYSS